MRLLFISRGLHGGPMAQSTRAAPWFMLSIAQGNLLQLAGLLSSLALLVGARRGTAATRRRRLVASWLLTYVCDHAIAHWAVGRLGGIRFVGYGVHGTTSPQWYPPGLRWVFQHLPLLSARTDPTSLHAAPPLARCAMYLAGPACTLLTGLGIPSYGRAAGIPGATRLLIGAAVWFLPMLTVEALRPGGDLHRAWRVLHRPPSPDGG